MSASGRALAEAMGSFGQNFQQMGETIYKVQAENDFRNESLKIASEIEQFNNSLLTDPDHGTPGSNDGYMKKWTDLKKTFDQRISSVKNPLAKQNLEGYLSQAQITQNNKIYGLQFQGWSKKMVADAEGRIGGIVANMAISTDFKLAQINEELDSLLSQNLIDEKQYGEYRTNFARTVVSQDFIKRVITMAKTEGYAATKDFIVGEVATVHMIGGVPVSIDTTDFSKGSAILDYTISGDQKAGDDEAAAFTDLVLSNKATEADYKKVLASPNMSYSQKTASIREWYQNKGDKELASALIGVTSYYSFARGEATDPGVKFTTLKEIQGLLDAKKISNQEYLTVVNIYNQSLDLIEKSDRSKEVKSLLQDIISGKVQTVDEVNARSPEGDTSALSFFLQTQEKNKGDAQIKAATDGLGKIRSLDKKVAEKTADGTDFDDIEAWIEENKETLGSSYGTVSSGISQLRWKFQDTVSSDNAKTIEEKLRKDPSTVSDDDIWSKDISAADSSRLATLKYSLTKEADLTEGDRNAKEVIARYNTNITLKNGATLKPGQKQLTREFLESVKDKLPISVYESFSSQLARDSTENMGIGKYFSFLKDINDGKPVDAVSISQDQSIPFNMRVDLLQKAMAGEEDSEVREISVLALNLVMQLNGELPEGERVLDYEKIKTLKSSRAVSIATSALSASVEFLKKQGRSSSFLAAYKKVVNGETKDALSILGDASMEPEDRIQLYQFYISNDERATQKERSDIQWQRTNEEWLNSKKTQEGYAAIAGVYSKILAGTLSNTELKALGLTPQQEIEVAGQVESNKRYFSGKSETEIQDHNSYLVNEKYQIAKRTASGTLKKGESPVSLEEFRDFVALFDDKALPLSVRKLYQDAADLLDETIASDRLDGDIRTKGQAWVASGKVSDDEVAALTASINGAAILDKSGARALLDSFVNNAKAVARQMEYDKQNVADQKFTDTQRAEAATRKAEQEGRKAAASGIRERFIEDLKKGMDPELFLGYQLQYEEVYKDAPEEYASAFHPLEVLYLSKQDVDYGKKEQTAQRAFSELVNSKMIEGWEKTTEPMTYDMINEMFPSESETDNKARAYWTEKVKNFLASDEASQIERRKAVDVLISARSNRWAGVYGSPEYDQSAPMLSAELLKQYRGSLKISDIDGFSTDIDNFAKAEYAVREAAEKEEKGVSYSPSDIAAGKDVYSRLQGYAAMLAMGTISSGYSNQTITITKNGVQQQVTLTPELFDAILLENTPSLIASGDLGDAIELKQKFMGKVTNPIWSPVEDTIKLLTSNGKYPNKFPPELQRWVDLEIAQTPNPTPEYIEKLVANLKTRSYKLDMKNFIKLKQGAWDVSEEYLSMEAKGELEPFVGTVNGVVGATLKEFDPILTGWAENTIKQVNFALGADLIARGKNAKQEIFNNGHMQFRVTDKDVLSKAGVAGTEAVFYMAFYGNDALPVREVRNGKSILIQAFIPWEKEGDKEGRWVLVEPKRDADGVVRFAKTQAQISADKASGVTQQNTAFASPDAIYYTADYPGYN